MPLPIRWSPWQTYDGIRESQFPAIPAGLPEKYLSSFPVGTSSSSGVRLYVMGPSFEAYNLGQLPHADLDARLCAQRHIAAGHQDEFTSWDPGECQTIPTPSTDYEDATVFVPSLQQDFGVGTQSGHVPQLPLVGEQYLLNGFYAVWGLAWWPGWLNVTGDLPDGTPAVSIRALVQIPGWLEAMARGEEPQVEVLRIDGEAHLEVAAGDTPVLGCARPRPPYLLNPGGGIITPYSRMGAVEMASSPGGTSATLHYPDMALGESHHWDLASDRIAQGADPGEAESHLAQVTAYADFVWRVRIRFQGQPPLRWLNRDDGLGVTGARRARTGTSLQSTTRHRGYR
jgi:hypothetical protein